MTSIFSRITNVTVPTDLVCESSTSRSPAFEVRFVADGHIPFPQLVIWEGSNSTLVVGDDILRADASTYVARIRPGLLPTGEFTIQVEGCKRADIANASANDWVKEFAIVRLSAAPHRTTIAVGPSPDVPKLYYGIHKHMHQPYYNASNTDDWDGAKDGIFASRQGPYSAFIPDAVRQYIEGGLPHAGLSTSWSGTLIEQLDRCATLGRAGGVFSGWNHALRDMATARTELGNPRIEWSGFHFFHALLPLIPERDIVRGIEWHRRAVEGAFGTRSSPVMFPPETAFHARIIPALRRAGIEAVIYDSIHRFRACSEYPYAGPSEGLLPPNRSEQSNPPVQDWLQLHNIWAGSKISPSLLRPEVVRYEHPDGRIETIVGVPAERYIGNEDARGGFGALQYPSVLGQVYDKLRADGSFDPRHPPFFVLHSDGDNHGGGADSYYRNNTGQMVHWLQQDPRFELTTVSDYLARFPPDPERTVHLEPGSWSGADNGDAQFRKWFSRHEEAYSPDLNSWAVLTALQNVIHSVEDVRPSTLHLDRALRLLLTAETSCYWYWTGQHIWDQQVTNAANAALDQLASALETLPRADCTAPTIFPPWVTPENPGGKTWGNGGLVDAPRQGTVHTFVHDVCGLAAVELVVRHAGGEDTWVMLDHGPYPCQTGAKLSARYFTLPLPMGLGDVRYFVRARDQRGNEATGSLERIYLP